MRLRIMMIGAIVALLFPAAIATAAKVPSATVSAALNTTALRAGQTAVLAVVVDVREGLHAQSHTPSNDDYIKFVALPDESDLLHFGFAVYPPGEEKNYAALGKLNVYVGRVTVYIPVKVKADAAPGPIKIGGTVTLQACNENTCFPPEHPTFSVSTNIVAADAAVTPANADVFARAPAALLNGQVWATSRPATTEPAISEPAIIAPATRPAASGMAPPPGSSATEVNLFGHVLDLNHQPLVISILVAFLAGVIFNIVPCVLPVLPLKAIGFYEVSQHNRARTLLLGFVFSCGLVAVFAALGLLILLSKSIFGSQISWGQQFSHPWFVWGVAIVLALLGLGMFGLFSVNLPTSIYGLDFRHDTLSGNFMWGALTAILSTPCTAPLFPPVLACSLALPVFEGFFLVSMVGVGMASPYFFLSAFPELARQFPRTGAVSELVKQMMGFLLLASASYFAALELVGEPNLWWVVFAVVVWACLYLVIRTPQVSKSPAALYITTALAVAIVSGAAAITLRLSNFFPPQSSAATAAAEVQWKDYSPQALAEARKDHKIVLIDFTANWCANCKYVETTVYRDPRAIDALHERQVVTLRADLTRSDAAGWPLLNDLGNTGIPYTAIYLPELEKPVGLASIYTTDTLLGIIEQGTTSQPVAAAR